MRHVSADEIGPIHFGGIGMSGIAEVLINLGRAALGCPFARRDPGDRHAAVEQEDDAALALGLLRTRIPSRSDEQSTGEAGAGFVDAVEANIKR